MRINSKLFYLIKSILLTISFCVALYFENAHQHRLILLISIFFIYLIVGLIRLFLNKEKKLFLLLFILDIILVYILEYNSRLLINYFFHSFYLIILLEAVLLLNMKNGIIVGSIAVTVSMIKYGQLIYYKFDLSSVSQMAFFLMANILILVTTGFGQYNRQERERKDLLYKELLDAHKKMKEYNEEVNRLSVVEERNRIARDIHDSLGHNMTALIMQLQMTEHFLNDDINKVQELLKSSIKTARDSLTSIREVVETLRGREENISIEIAIKNLVKDYSKKTGTEISLNIESNTEVYENKLNTDMYRIIQEAMTNAIRHGKATIIDVNLNFKGDCIMFFVRDNGIGAREPIDESYGLRGIRERVAAYNGNVEFISDHGFKVEGILYLEGRND